MTVKKRDFQKVVHDVKDFLSKLCGNDTAELRDALNFSLLHLHKYYKKLRHKVKSNSLFDGSLSLSSSLGSLSPASPFIPPVDRFDWRWVNLDAAKLSASFGYGDKSNLLPEVFYVLKDADVQMLKQLIENDKDCVNEIDALGRSTALYCIHGKSDAHLQCLDILMENGVDILQEANDGLTCIHLAAATDNEQAIEKLLEQQININVEDSEGRYPLHFAAGYGSASITRMLLDAGADKTSLDNDEMTPVMWACHFDKYENMEILLNITGDDEMKYEHIDVELQDKDLNGQTILHWSVTRSINKDCFKVLFSADYADLRDDNEKTILHIIAEKGAFSCLQEYLAVCDVKHLESMDRNNRTPLHLACMYGHGEVVDVLLNRGASLGIIDKQGFAPFDYTKAKNLNYCMLVVLSHQKYREKVAGDGVKGDATTRNGITGDSKILNGVKDKPPGTSNAQMLQVKKVDTSSLASEQKSQESVIKKEESPAQLPTPPLSRRTSDASQFDTPQEDNEDLDGYAKDETDRKILHEGSPDEDKSDDIEMNLNERLIVLVEHHGSDDELIIDVDGVHDERDDYAGDDIIFSGKDVDVEEDQDLLDVPTFARNGSITTVGVVSEGSMAFNSVSVNPSVSSLASSDESEEEKGFSKRKSHAKRSPTSDPFEARSTDSRNSSKKDRYAERPGSHHAKKPFAKQKPVHSLHSPRGNLTASMDSHTSNVTAPVMPASQYYNNSHSQNSQVLVVHGPERNEQRKNTRQKRSLTQGNAQYSQQSTREQRSPLSPAPNVLGQSWPPMHGKNFEDDFSSSHQLSPRGSKRLAPISPHNFPRPPSYR